MKACIIGGQLARRYKLPYRTSSTNAANSVDAQAAYETVFSLWGAIMGGGNLIQHAAGWLEGGLVASYEKFALDVDLLQMVIEYLKTPPTRERLVELIAAMGIAPRALLREKGTPYAELGLDNPKWSDDELIEFMLTHPILINRPIVVTEKGVRLCRPSESVLDILSNPAIGKFVKEDGEIVSR